MKYLLDTNVISETIKPSPAPKVIAWLEEIQRDGLYISAVTLGEIYRGIEKLPDGKRRKTLQAWVDSFVPEWFGNGNRILPFDEWTAEHWGRISAHMRSPVQTLDSLIAATAIANRATLVTRNRKDFSVPGLKVLNPWE